MMIKSFDDEFDEDYSDGKLFPTQELRRVSAFREDTVSDDEHDDDMQGSAFPIRVLSLNDFGFPSVPVRFDFDRAVFPVGDESLEVAPGNVRLEDSSDTAMLGAPALVNISVEESVLDATTIEGENRLSPSPSQPLRSPPRSLSPRMDSPLQSRIDALRFDRHDWKVRLHPPSSDEKKEGRAFFLKTTCLGPAVQSAPHFGLGSVLQLGDVLVELNGEDISSLDAGGAQRILDGLVGEVVSLSFLRKTMVV